MNKMTGNVFVEYLGWSPQTELGSLIYCVRRNKLLNLSGPQFPHLKMDTCTPMLIAALFTSAKRWEQPRAHGWMNG